MNIVTVHNLKKYFGKGETQIKALDGVDLEIEKGKFTAIIGASGSGKTTLLNMMGGMDVPDEGEVVVDGVNLRGLKEKELAVFRRRKIGFIFQFYNLIPVLTAEENITLPVRLDGRRPDAAYLNDILETLGLAERRRHLPNQLSGGQQQRVAVGRALIHQPALILADEPTGNLDTRNGREIIALLKASIRRYGQTLILITHDPSIAAQADRVIIMEDGRIRGEGATL